MPTTWNLSSNKTKLTFLLSLTFLFLFGSLTLLFANDSTDVAEEVLDPKTMEMLNAFLDKDFKKVCEMNLPLAESGDQFAQWSLGNCYLKGNGVEQDYKQAFKWYSLSAKQGHKKAQYDLGVMYDKGEGIPKNHKEAFKWFLLSSEQGYPSAQKVLAGMYEYGRGVERNYKEAIKWHRLSAEQGNADSQNFLGLMYENGKGVSVNYKEAIKWYELAAKQKDAFAQNNLGVIYYQGKGVPKDDEEALKWFSFSAEQGNETAQVNLDLLKKELENNKGSKSKPSNTKEPEDDKWIVEEMEGLGVIASVNGRITHGDRFRIRIEKDKCQQGELFFSFYTTQDNKKILALEGKVVEIKYNQEIVKSKILSVDKFIMGHIAMFHLGFKPLDFIVNFHKNLKNISIELIDTATFKASDYFDVLKNEWSLNNLEGSLLKGQSLCQKSKQSGEDSDTDEVIQLIGLAQKGDPDAQYKLAIMYAQGTIIPKNYEEAERLLRLAGKQGHPDAQYLLGLMYMDGEGVIKDSKEAVKWFRLAANQGHTRSQFTLGFAYRNGSGVPSDYKEAIKWYQLAAEQGNVDAQTNLGEIYSKVETVRDYKKSIKWYRLAAEQGNATAQHNMGALYKEGNGLPKNNVEAVRWYRLAAEQNFAPSQFNMGFMYETGTGVLKDYSTAHMWFNLCGSSGDQECVRNRKNLEEKMTPSQIEKAQDMASDWKPKK